MRLFYILNGFFEFVCSINITLLPFQTVSDQCVEVHVLNLVQPNQRRRAREMDTSHVKFLEESFLKSPGGEFNLLAGLLLKGSLEQVGNEGGATVEVIGGNHTRAALTSLYRRGLRSPLVRVRLYGDLTDEEALHIGYNHNELATRSKKMSFTDKAEIVRKIIQLHPNNSRKKLADFFGYEVNTDGSAICFSFVSLQLWLDLSVYMRNPSFPTRSDTKQNAGFLLICYIECQFHMISF